MALTIKPLHPLFVAEVTGLDIREPLSLEIQAQIKNLIDQHGILIFRDQNISDDQQVVFSRYFGEIEIANTANTILRNKNTADYPICLLTYLTSIKITNFTKKNHDNESSI